MTDVVELAREIAARVAPDSLLDAADAAALLKCSERYFSDRIARVPGFPQALRLTTTEGRTHPRWRRQDIMLWIDSHARSKVGRPRKVVL